MYNIETPIKDMKKVVEKMGGTLEEDDSLGSFSDGIIKKEEKGQSKFTICVPKNQSEQRKNFTIAHELGHLFIHMGYQLDEDLWNKSDGISFNRKGNSEPELEANEFAAAFLMPEEQYEKAMNENSENDTVFIGKVAEYFNVSSDAASYRGKWLGYLQW